MTLTVRLPQPLEDSLDAYCAKRGLSTSHVVQACLGAYLFQARAGELTATPLARVSPAYAAFKRAGRVGSVNLGNLSATRYTVRQRALQRLQRRAS